MQSQKLIERQSDSPLKKYKKGYLAYQTDGSEYW